MIDDDHVNSFTGSDRYGVTGSALHNSKCLIAVLSNCYVASKYSTR